MAEQLAAKSREPEGDPALTEAPEETVPEEAAPEGADGDEAEVEGLELVSGEHELSGGEVYAAVEALLFAADKPVTAAQIARALPSGVNAREVRSQLKAIRE